jgi:hypothetical protein
MKIFGVQGDFCEAGPKVPVSLVPHEPSRPFQGRLTKKMPTISCNQSFVMFLAVPGFSSV